VQELWQQEQLKRLNKFKRQENIEIPLGEALLRGSATRPWMI
jgi:hypothetical protein